MKHTSPCLLLITMLLLAFQSSAQNEQTVSGRIYDEASGAPLTGAIIALLNTANGTATDTNGNYKLSVPLGRQSFRVSYTGYETRTATDIIVTAGKQVTLNIGLQEAVHKLNEVKVVYNKAKDKTRTNNEMAQVSARSFNVEETKKYAGSLGDPSRMAANFAGVVSGNDATNDIVIRGNSPNGLLWQMEGINIPNPNHYGSLTGTGGPVSMLNNNTIDKSDFLTSAFPAQYGNATSGVFDIRIREGNKEKPEYMAQVGFNGFELGAEGPLGKNKNTTYLINYRYSTLGVFQKLGISFGTGAAIPYYQDVNYKVVSNLSRTSKLSLFGFAGASKINFLGKDVDTGKNELFGGDPYSNDKSKYGASVTGLAYEQRFSEKGTTRFTLAYSTTYEKYDGDSISNIDYSVHPDTRIRLSGSKISANWMLKYKLDARNNFETGATFDINGFKLKHEEFHPGSPTDVFANKNGSYGLAQAYGQWKHRFSNKLSGVGGIHGQYNTLNGQVVVEPRISARYALNPRQAVSIGYGLNHQAQNIYTYFYETDVDGKTTYTNKNLKFTASNHFVAGYDWNVTEHLRIKAEAYYQSLNKVPVEQLPSAYSGINLGSTLGFEVRDSLVNKGTGYNYGLEFTAERFFHNGYYFLATTSLFNSRYKGSDGVDRNTGFNTGYVINTLAGKEFKVGRNKNVLAVNLKFTTLGGRYLTPIDLAASIREGYTVYNETKAFTERQAPYMRTDLKLAYRKNYKHSTLELALDLQNVTNHKNIFSKDFDKRTGKIKTVYQQAFFPIPMIRYTF